MNIANWLQATARRQPDSPALFRGTRQIADYGEFARRASAIGASLLALDLQAGDRVALYMKNATDYLELLYATWWIGAVAVPLNAKLHPKEVDWILQDCGAKLLICDPGTEPALTSAGTVQLMPATPAKMGELRAAEGAAQPRPCSADDIAWLFYTSGTTGNPKGVMITHGNLLAMSLCYPVDVDSVEAGDAILYAAPMSHGAGLYNFIHVRCGARHVVPESGGFDPVEILQLARQLRQVSMFAAPTMLRRLVAEAQTRGEPGSGIKCIVYGGAPMYQADLDAALQTLGPCLAQIYGQGESPMTIAALSRPLLSRLYRQKATDKLYSTGQPHSCIELRVVDPQGNPLPAGEVGEVLVRGPTVMAGYWQDHDATQATLRDGWLWTGDMGSLDPAGYLTLSDRSKDVIISGGSNIYPREVEEALLKHPAVQEVSVIGRPHPDWGEEVVAFIVTSPGQQWDPALLDAHCLAEIARFKRPKTYLPIAALPKNNYGKVLKTVLRSRLRETPTG